MPRPLKDRHVCSLPEFNSFMPEVNSDEVVVLLVEEYEAIRLIDLEGLSQEEASISMNVARTTVQSIYTSARKKIADVIVNGKRLKIAGGNYCLTGKAHCKRKACCKRNQVLNEKEAEE